MEAQLSIGGLLVRDITGGGLTEMERELVRTWTGENPSHARMLARLRDAQWRMQEWQAYKEVDKEAVWNRMQARAAELPGVTPLPSLEHRDWMGMSVKPAAKGRIMKVWAVISTLILYHNH
jgi:hypothetical protein